MTLSPFDGRHVPRRRVIHGRARASLATNAKRPTVDNSAHRVMPPFASDASTARTEPESDSPGRCGAVRYCTTRQSNTHSTDSRQVLYPWHPWYGRTVWVHDVRVRAGQAVAHCRLDPGRGGRALAIPQWMLDTASCCQICSAQWPAVSVAALLELKRLLAASAVRAEAGVVVEAQHRPSSFTGGADATVSEATTHDAAATVSSRTQRPELGAVTARDPTAERETTRTAATRALGKKASRAAGRGGAR